MQATNVTVSPRPAVVAALLLCLLPAGARSAEPLHPNVVAQLQALAAEKASRTPAQRKIASQLLNTIKVRSGQAIAQGLFVPRKLVPEDRRGLTLVDIRTNDTPAVSGLIASLGGEVVFSSERFRSVRAKVSLARMETLAAHPGVRFIRPAVGAMTNKVNTSEGDITHASRSAREGYGVYGSNSHVCVLSDGVDTLASRQATGDLPATVNILSGQAGTGDEGTAMLEIVYDLAPSAELSFATAFSGMASFAQNILDLRSSGCDVIVDDVFYFAESPFQDDTIAQAVNTVTADGALYFSSAGNSGNLNDSTSGVWEGDFNDGGAASSPLPAYADRIHDFSGTGVTYNTVTDDSSCCPTVLFWSDPLDGSANDYDLYILNSTGTSVVDSSENSQTGTQDPFEIVSTPATGERIVIVKYSGVARYLHLNTYRGRLTYATDGQTAGHATALDAMGVAAVSANNLATVYDGSESVEYFSSDGPRRMFYEANGTPYTPGNFLASGGVVRNKPDIAAADGVDTSTPGFSSFYGTSAAAPHAAAIAALLLDADPVRSPGTIKTALTSTALDIEAVGFDRDSGYGLIMADRALASMTTRSSVTRAQAAVAILLAKHGPNYAPPAAAGGVFSDVAATDAAADWIEQLNTEGITEGCGGGNYCPQMPITKEQFAKMVWKAKYGVAAPPDAVSNVYDDVPPTHPFADWILGIKNDGITSGCNASNYCPAEALTFAGLDSMLGLAFP